MSATRQEWYHGGDLENGTPGGRVYLHVHHVARFAKGHANQKPNGKVYRLLSKYNDLVEDHPNDLAEREDLRRKVIRQCNLIGGAMTYFEVLNPQP